MILIDFRYKEGPLVVMPKNAVIRIDSKITERLESIGAKGVIFHLPADKTYLVDQHDVKTYINDLIESFKNTSMKVVLDLTPNYVTTEDDLYQLAGLNETYRSAFVWEERHRVPNNWLSKVPNKKTNGTAWQLATQTNNYVLSQFGENNIDLQLSDPIAKEKFKGVLRKLIKLGVKGFRLANAQHYIINKELPDDVLVSNNPGVVHTDYEFWTHTSTTNQPGIGDLLHEFWLVVNNETNGEGFLSVTDFIDHPEVFNTTDKTVGFDLPIVANLTSTLLLTSNSTSVAKKLEIQLTNAINSVGNAWQQWPYDKLADDAKVGRSEYNLFLFLLPGVPVGTLDDFFGNGSNATLEEIKKLEALRKTQSYQHGNFKVYTGVNDTIIAYSR